MIADWRVSIGYAVLVGMALGAGGCGEPTATSDVGGFVNAGPAWPQADLKNLARQNAGEPYRIGPGDVLELHMPPSMRQTIADDKADPFGDVYLARVAGAGTIRVPIVGDLTAGGKTTQEVEKMLASSFYPKYLTRSPAVLVTVKEYDLIPVTVSGMVKNPGVYELKRNERTVVSALMRAGGVLPQGAGTIRVQGGGGREEKLALYGQQFPSKDVALQGGETVLVEQLDPQVFTVLGLVKKPGAYPYPPNMRYTLMQAVGLAGGIQEIADPQYAKIYRGNSDGTVKVGTFRLRATGAETAPDIQIKPGDIVALEHTPRTQVRAVLADMLRLGAGVNVGANYSMVP